eukprot:403341429
MSILNHQDPRYVQHQNTSVHGQSQLDINSSSKQYQQNNLQIQIKPLQEQHQKQVIKLIRSITRLIVPRFRCDSFRHKLTSFTLKTHLISSLKSNVRFELEQMRKEQSKQREKQDMEKDFEDYMHQRNIKQMEQKINNNYEMIKHDTHIADAIVNTNTAGVQSNSVFSGQTHPNNQYIQNSNNHQTSSQHQPISINQQYINAQQYQQDNNIHNQSAKKSALKSQQSRNNNNNEGEMHLRKTQSQDTQYNQDKSYLSQSNYDQNEEDNITYQDSFQFEPSVKGFKKKYNLIRQKDKQQTIGVYNQPATINNNGVQSQIIPPQQQLNSQQPPVSQNIQAFQNNQKQMQLNHQVQNNQYQQDVPQSTNNNIQQTQHQISLQPYQQEQLQQVLKNKETELQDKEFLLEVERLNNPKRKEEESVMKQTMSGMKKQVDSEVQAQARDVERELQQMESQWQIVDQLTKEKDLIRDRAMKLLTEEKRKYISDLSKYKSHKGKMDNKVKSQKDMQTQIMKDIVQMRDNLREKVQELIVIGVDFDEVFYEMRDDEELKWEAKHDIEVPKSAICKKLNFKCIVSLGLTSRKKNMDIQTYNVDFLLENDSITKDLKTAQMNEDLNEKAQVQYDQEEGQYRNYLSELKKEKLRIQKQQEVESLKKSVIQEQLTLQKLKLTNSKELYDDEVRKQIMEQQDINGNSRNRRDRAIYKSVDRVRTPIMDGRGYNNNQTYNHGQNNLLNRSVAALQNYQNPVQTLKYGNRPIFDQQSPYHNNQQAYNTVDASTGDNYNIPTQRFSVIDPSNINNNGNGQMMFATQSPQQQKIYIPSSNGQVVNLPMINQRPAGPIDINSGIPIHGQQQPAFHIQPMFTNGGGSASDLLQGIEMQNQQDSRINNHHLSNNNLSLPEEEVDKSDFEFLSNILRQNQKNEIAQLMRELEKQRAQEKIEQIKRKYEERYADLLDKTKVPGANY